MTKYVTLRPSRKQTPVKAGMVRLTGKNRHEVWLNLDQVKMHVLGLTMFASPEKAQEALDSQGLKAERWDGSAWQEIGKPE